MECGWRTENRAVFVGEENIAIVPHAHERCDIADAAAKILGEGFAVEGGLQKTVTGLEGDADVTGLCTAVGFRLQRLGILFFAVQKPQELCRLFAGGHVPAKVLGNRRGDNYAVGVNDMDLGEVIKLEHVVEVGVCRLLDAANRICN